MGLPLAAQYASLVSRSMGVAESLDTSCRISTLHFAAADLLSNCSGVNSVAGVDDSFSEHLSFRGGEGWLWVSSDIMVCVLLESLGGLGKGKLVSCSRS